MRPRRMREAYVGGRGGSERRQREAVWAVFNSPPKWVRGSRRRQVILSPDGAATGDLTVAESYPHFASSGCHRAGYYITQVGRRPRTKKLPTGRPGWHPWSGPEGSSGIIRMPPRGNELCRALSVGFPSEGSYIPSMGATTEKKDAPVSFFWGPLWGPWLTEASFVLTMLCSHLFVFLPFYSSYIKTPALPCAERGFMAVIRCFESGLFLAIKYVYVYRFIAKICGFIFTSTGPVGTVCCEIVTKLFVKSRMNRQD